jgi:hypothetical protein
LICTPDEGPFTRSSRLSVAPSLVDMAVIDAIRQRLIEVVKSPEAFDGDVVTLLGGKQVRPDAVICTTGYRRGLDSLVGHLGVLDERGAPRVLAPAAAAAGLRFLGFLARPSMLGYTARLSRRMSKQIVAEYPADEAVRPCRGLLSGGFTTARPPRRLGHVGPGASCCTRFLGMSRVSRARWP